MKILLVLISTTLAIPSIWSQQLGYFGRKNFLEIAAQSSVGVGTSQLNEKMYKQSGNRLSSSSDMAHFYGSVIIGRVMKKKLSMSLEIRSSIGQYIPGPTGFLSPLSNTAVGIKHERLLLNTFSFIPTFEIGGKKSLLPIGLTHQLGLGISTDRIAEKDYLYTLPNSSFQPDLDAYLATKKTIVKAYTASEFNVSYTLKCRIPYSRKNMISVGLRFQGNFTNDERYDGGHSNPAKEIASNVYKYRMSSSIISFVIGHVLSW